MRCLPAREAPSLAPGHVQRPAPAITPHPSIANAVRSCIPCLQRTHASNKPGCSRAVQHALAASSNKQDQGQHPASWGISTGDQMDAEPQVVRWELQPLLQPRNSRGHDGEEQAAAAHGAADDCHPGHAQWGQHELQHQQQRLQQLDRADRTGSASCSSVPGGAGSRASGGVSQRQQSSSVPDARLLTWWIKRARTWQQLQQLVYMYNSSFNYVNVSAAVTHLAQLLGRLGSQTSSSSSGHVRGSGVSEAISNGGGASPVLSRAARVRSGRRTSRTNSLLAPPPTASAQHLPGAAAASDPRIIAFCTTLQQLLSACLDELGPRQLANCAWAVSKWPPAVQGRPQLLSRLLQRSQRHLRQACNAQELANLLYACGAVAWELGEGAATGAGCEAGAADASAGGLVLPDGWLLEHAAACAPQLEQFKMQELSNMLWAYGGLGSSRLQEASAAAAAAATGPEQPVVLAGDAALPKQRQQQQQQEQGSGHDWSATVRSIQQVQLAHGLDAAHPCELAGSITGLANLQEVPGPQWLSAFVRASLRQLRGRNGVAGFGPQELSNTLWALGSLRLPVHAAFLREALAGAAALAPTMTQQERVNTLWGIAWQLRMQPGLLPQQDQQDTQTAQPLAGDPEGLGSGLATDNGNGSRSPAAYGATDADGVHHLQNGAGVPEALSAEQQHGPPRGAQAKLLPAKAAATVSALTSSILRDGPSTLCAQDFANMWWALASLECAAPSLATQALPEHHARAFAQLWRTHAVHLTPQGHANVLWAAWRLGMGMAPDLQAVLLPALKGSIASSGYGPSPECWGAAEVASAVRSLGELLLQPSGSWLLVVAELLELAYLDADRYGQRELLQACYGCALLLHSAAPGASVSSAVSSAVLINGSSEGLLQPPPAIGSVGLGRGPAAAASKSQSTAIVPASLEVSSQLSDHQAGMAAGGQQRWPSKEAVQLQRCVDRLLLRLQQRHSREPQHSMHHSELCMALTTAGLLLPEHMPPSRVADVGIWVQDLVRGPARRLLQVQPHLHVSQLAPLLLALTSAARGAARAGKASRDAARRLSAAMAPIDLTLLPVSQARQGGKRPASAGGFAPGAASGKRLAASRPAALSSKDLFESNGRVAERRRQQQQQQRHSQERDGARHPAITSQQHSHAFRASGLSHEWMAACWRASGPTLHEATAQEAASALWALMSLAVHPPPGWAHQLLVAVKPQLSATSDHTLGVLLFAAGHLKLRPPAGFVATTLAEVCRRAGRLDPRVVQGVLCGLAEMDLSAEPEFAGAAAPATAGSGNGDGDRDANEAQLPQDWLAELVRRCTPQLLSLAPADRTKAYMAVVSLEPQLADRLGYEFSELSDRLVPFDGEAEGTGGGGGGRRVLFAESRAGWR